METKVRIVISNLTYKYEKASAAALSDLNLTVHEGEFVSIFGANGSGKSTLLSCINGLCSPEPGMVTVYGADGRGFDSAREGDLREIRTICGTVLQNPDKQIAAPTVEEDCAFGPENLFLPEKEIAARVDAALAACGIEELRSRPVQFLSGGEKQRLAIAGSLAMGSDILLLDEPVSMLDPAGRERFYALIANLLKDGKTIVQITHSREDALRGGRCVILDKGRITYDGEPNFEAPTPAVLPPKKAAGKVCVSFNNVTHKYNAGLADVSALTENSAQKRRSLDGFSLDVYENERLAIVGRTGCGKSTALKHINALLLPSSGSVKVEGRDTLHKSTDLSALRRTASLAMQSPETAMFETFVADDVAYGARNLGLKGAALLARVKSAMESAGLPFEEFANRETASLSGGEARLAALAGILALDSPIVLLDEPTAGLDEHHSAQILATLEELKACDKTVVVSTHSMEFAACLDRVEMIDGGKIAGAGKACAADDKNSGEPASPRRRKTGLEFFRGVSFEGLYKPHSALTRLGAPLKLIFLLILAVLSAALPGRILPPLFLAFVIIAGGITGKISPPRLFGGFVPALPAILFFIALRIVFSFSDDASAVLFQIGPVAVTLMEIEKTLLLLVRLFTLMALIALYASSTTLRETSGALKKALAPFAKVLPVRDICLVINITLRFIPLISTEALHIAESQIARGAKTRGLAKLALIKSMIIPLFLRSLSRAQTLAEAMLLRLY